MNSEINLNDSDKYWLAGLLEGEGCFGLAGEKSQNYLYPYIAVQMTDEDIIKRIANLWNRKYQFRKRQKPHHKDIYITRITRNKARLYMEYLLPLMGLRRSKKIKEIIELDLARIRKTRAKFTDQEIHAIKARIDNGESLREIGRSFNLSHETIRQNLIRLNIWP